MYFRQMGRNSFAMTFEVGTSDFSILRSLTAELTKKVDGVSYYGYELGEYMEILESGAEYRLQYLIGAEPNGRLKNTILRTRNGSMAIAQVGEGIYHNGFAMYGAGWHVDRCADMNIKISHAKSRLSLYVFATARWLIICPRMHGHDAVSIYGHSTAAGGLFAIDLDKSVAASEYDYHGNYCVGQLAYLGGQGYSEQAGYWNHKFGYDMLVIRRPVYTPLALRHVDTSTPLDFINYYEDSYWRFNQESEASIVMSHRGYQVFETYPDHYPIEGEVSELGVCKEAYNYWEKKFRPPTPYSFQRPMFGIKQLQPNGTYNLLDKISINCNEKGFIDAENGTPVPHTVITGCAPYTPSGNNRFYFAIPS